MAIRKRTARDPFLDRESAIKALEGFIDGTRTTREGMYLLQVINTHIQNGERIFERTPQSVFCGLPGGGRANVQAAALCRAEEAANAAEQGSLLESGYTREQEIIGHWAERDGCWSDTPEADLLRNGHEHRSEYDGSEARIFYNSGAHVYKTIDFVRYESMSRFLDRVTIHNAVFPEAMMTIYGFGVRDYSEDSTGFCALVSQPFIEGTTPTEAQIHASMLERGLHEPAYSAGSGFYFYETPDHDVLITDVHDNNCVVTPQGKVVVFDCEAMVNDINGFGGRYTIPPLQYSQESVDEIKASIRSVMPLSVPGREFLMDLSPVASHNAVEELASAGYIDGPVKEGPYKDCIVQRDPEDRSRLLVQSREKMERFFAVHEPKLDDGSTLTPKEKEAVLQGRPFARQGLGYRFNLDKGRIERTPAFQLKQRMTQARKSGISI